MSAKQKLLEIYDIRRENLKKLLATKQHGSIAAIAIKSGLHKSGLQKAVHVNKTFTEKYARSIEAGLNLDIGSLDRDANNTEVEAPVFTLAQAVNFSDTNLAHEEPKSSINIGTYFSKNTFCVKLNTSICEEVFPENSILLIDPDQSNPIAFGEHYLVIENVGVPVVVLKKCMGLNFMDVATNKLSPVKTAIILGKCTGIFFA